MHASIPPKYSKPNLEGDYGTLRSVATHETAPSQPNFPSLQPTNLNPDVTSAPSLLIPPPSDFSSGKFDDFPPIVPPPPTFEEDSLLQAIISETTPVDSKSSIPVESKSSVNSQPNYIFINNINEFGGLPAAIRTANYVRPDSTYETFSEAFFDKNDSKSNKQNLKYENQKFPKAEVAFSSSHQKDQPHFAFGPDKKSDISSTRYHLSTSEVQNVLNVEQDLIPEQRVETQYDMVFEKETSESVEHIPSPYPSRPHDSSSVSSEPPPLPKSAPPPLLDQATPSISKYLNLLSTPLTLSDTSLIRPETPPKPIPVVHTNTHAGGLDESKRRVFGSVFGQKVILCNK